MSDELPLSEPPEPEELERFDLGDCVADDEKLRCFLEYLEEKTNRDAPKTQAGRTADLLGIVKERFKTIWSATRESFLWVKKRFTDYDIRRAQAKKIEAEAGEKRAHATSTRKIGAAQAEVLEAKAEAIRIKTHLTYIRVLEAGGIDWRAEVDEDGHLNIVVTKPKGLRGFLLTRKNEKRKPDNLDK